MRARWQNEDFRRDVEAIRSDVHQLKADLTSAMRDLISAGREGVEESRDRLQEQVQQKLDALNQATEELGMYGRQATRRVRRELEENPARTALIVLGIGAVLGMLMMSGRRR
jgi:ElaB/YqjD/DUF883 family membrane-anchored ribosome-binding protein